LQHLLAVTGDCQIAVAREMTKIHEELVRGPISAVLKRLDMPRGEFTVVIELGHKQESASVAVDELAVFTEFGHLMENNGLVRRQAIAALARKYGRSSREVYESIERSKKLAE
jgi:16S rRNA (cytidine1402-2'-O)-methyltransferase